jgi:glycosyltransferase involved in cell wall biosynthesis
VNEREGHRRPRLLFVVNVGWFFLSHRLPLARAAVARGYDVHVACGVESPQEASDITAAGFTFHDLRLVRSSTSIFGALGVAARIRAVVRAVEPDVVHLVSVKTILLGGLVLPRRRSMRIVAAFSGLGHVFTDRRVRTRLLRAVLMRVYRFALRGERCSVIFQNGDDRAVFVDGGVVPADRTTLIRGVGVELARFDPAPVRGKRPRVLLPARMLREKGVLEFAEAARILRDRGVVADFVMAGGPDPQNPSSLTVEDLRRLEQTCGVRWLGHCADMTARYAEATIVCLPSYREGMPKVLAEAAAAGRPIVTTDVPGCREAVEAGVNGLLVPPHDGQAIADAIASLLADDERLGQMAAASRELAVRRFDERLLIERTLSLYDR